MPYSRRGSDWPVASVIALGVPPSSGMENRCGTRSSIKWSQCVTGGRSQVIAVIFESSRTVIFSLVFAQSVISGQTDVMKAMRRESGNHLGADTPVGTSLTRIASPPFVPIT